jgi:hypothetical protein
VAELQGHVCVRTCVSSAIKNLPHVLLMIELKRNKSRASVRPRRRSCAGRENSVSPLHRLPPFIRASEEEEGAAEVLHQQLVSEPHGLGLWRGEFAVSTAAAAAAVARCDAVRAVDAEARRRHAAASGKVVSECGRNVRRVSPAEELGVCRPR